MMASMSDVERFRRQAADAREMATRSHSTPVKDNWHEIAKNWDLLAEEAARLATDVKAKPSNA